MEWVSMLAVLTTVTSVLCQLVGVEICFRIVRQRSTGDVSAVPFIAFFVSAVVWVKYGLMTDNKNVILTSGQATILQFLYICIYYAYTSQKRFLTGMILIGLIGLVVPFVYVTYFENEADIAVRNLGLYCCFLSVIVYASPLATLTEVVKERSTHSISLPLCFFNFLCAVEWTLYGLAISDQMLTIPNALGVVLGLVQFFLFCFYGCQHKSSKPILG
ncbi:unnamed protein product [Candidula unifasciata]|uniref:Sugar transporter SWEET1 n=1 Tax=Candidula unifasciata TaxID=100452 RepID=A0A8S3YWZ7_9EUPU|nr:unnamed protein product [Candidula unifasciata]